MARSRDKSPPSRLVLVVALVAIGWTAAPRSIPAADAATTPPAAPAAAPSDEGLANLSLEALTSIKVQTVYGASKHEQKVTEAPSAVSIVTREEIQQFGYRTLADILNSVRGFYVTYDRGYSHIGVRGFDRLGDYGGRVLLMVDGHRLNDGIFSTAASGTDFLVDVDLIERVEIIRGPGSSLYGDNAFFAVINVITRKGRDVNGAEVSSSYGTFDSWTGRATYGRQFTNGLEFLLSGSLYSSDGQPNLGYPEFTAHHLDGGWAHNVLGSLSFEDFTLRGGFVDRSKDWPTAAYGTVPDAQHPKENTIDEREYAELSFQHDYAGDWRLSARAYFDRYRYDGYYAYDYDGDPSTPPVSNRDLAESLSAGTEISASKTLWNQHRLTAGGEWRHDFELLQQNWDVNPYQRYLDSEATANVLGLYAQDEWSLRTNLIINAGLRYDYYSAFGGTLNPRIALIYSPWESTTLKALYGSAFRAPNAYELYYKTVDFRPNPDLRPEKDRSYELIWEQRFGPHWNGSLSGFWNDVSGLINELQDPGANGLFYFGNSGSAVARGIEFELEGKLLWGIHARASYTFTDTQDKATGNPLDNSPQHLGKLNLSLPLWRDQLSAGLELQTMSQRRTIEGNDSGAFALVNFTLFSRELVKGLELSASVYNLFNQSYTHPVSADFNYVGPISGNVITLDQIAQDGRSFRVKLTWRF